MLTIQKIMNYLKVKILFSLIILLSLNSYSQTKISTDFKEYSLEIFKSENIKNLDIRGNHAQINLLNWDKDSISVETSIEILSDKPNLSKEMLDEIRIKVVTYGNTLQVKTTTTEDFNRTIPYNVIYNIFYPVGMSLQLKNSNGEVNIANISGITNLKLDYCDFNIKNLSFENDSTINTVELNYSQGSINSFGKGKLIANNSKINIHSAVDVELISNYNILSIDNIEHLKGESKIDNLKINQCADIKLKSTQSIVNIQQLKLDGLFEGSKGSLNIGNTSNELKKLTINNQNTKTSLKINELVSYTINGEIYKGKLIHPQINSLQLVKETDKVSFNGVIGNNLQSDTKVIIFNTNQNVEFK